MREDVFWKKYRSISMMIDDPSIPSASSFTSGLAILIIPVDSQSGLESGTFLNPPCQDGT